ncbi:hypothetical protein BDV98DRAFT_584515 [Pterulicium gracile]|uniref:Uncharacterized protein n=1 Tax=Pterulicium gracile TaxID=1884261 RepID=A0A5C3QKM6_9AGAR|nr:hypothetical protein BDV98DRAFT_584515 [Pterula gracilis]
MESTDGDPTVMTPQLSLALSRVGKNLLFFHNVLLGQLAAFGVYFVLVVMASYLICRRRGKGLREILLFFALILTFFVTTFDWASGVVSWQQRLTIVLLDSKFPSLTDRLQETVRNQREENAVLYAVRVWLAGVTANAGLVFLINDILACWRAVALSMPWCRNWKTTMIQLGLYFLVFSSFALWVSLSVISMQLRLVGGASGPTSRSNVFDALVLAASATSIAANLLATGMIGWVTWEHFGLTSDLPKQRSKLAIYRIPLYLTESGLFYALIQAMYTPAVILIVKSGVSISDDIDSMTLHSGDTSSLSGMVFNSVQSHKNDGPTHSAHRASYLA